MKAKQCLTSAPVLAHYDPTLPIILAGNASAYGVGAVISHSYPDGSERPIAYASRTLSSAENKYAQVEKEALALIFGLSKYHQYLYGRTFILQTDHKPLTTILGPTQGIPSLAAARLQRWAIQLAGYSYKIRFRPTQQHCNADGLSRLPLRDNSPVGNPPDPAICNICQVDALPVTSSELQTATRADPILGKVLSYVRRRWSHTIANYLKPYKKNSQELSIEGDCLFRGTRVVVPSKLRQKILNELHKGHSGIVRMKALARSHVWWPGLDEDITNMVKGCVECQSVKHLPAKAPLHPWAWPTSPWEQIHVDFLGPFLEKMFFLVTDAHSKWPEVTIMPSTTASKTISILRELFARFGIPQQLVSDNGPQFISEEFKQFMSANGVKHIKSSPYHPASNGAAERIVQTLKLALKADHKKGVSLDKALANFLLQYRITPHATTGVSPCNLMMNRGLCTRLDLLKPDIATKVHCKQADQKQYSDRTRRPRQFSVMMQLWHVISVKVING